MKKSLLSVLTVILLSAASAQASTRGISVKLFGKQESPDFKDEQAVLNLLGEMVSDLTISAFVVKAWGAEGGFDVCLTSRLGPEKALARLNAIVVNSEITFYAVASDPKCEQ